MPESIVILLTGTIKVAEVPDLLLKDTNTREKEYYKAIKKWIALDYPIIFCENSNYESEMMNELVKNSTPQNFEYLKFSTAVSHLGKGNGEAEIIDYIFKNSKLINNHTIICKATGKNFVTNAKAIIRKVLQPAIAKNVVIALLIRNLTKADSRFFFFKKEFYLKYWINHIGEVNEKERIYIEHTLAKSIHIAIAAGEKWTLPPELPVIEGYIGTTGTLYKYPFIKTSLINFSYGILKKWL